MKKKTALIAGATGLIGAYLLDMLLRHEIYDTVKVISRKAITRDDKKLKVILLEDFASLSKLNEEIYKADDIFCCLGTTTKKAGSKKAFWSVDYEYPYTLAELGKKAGTRQFLLVSAIGASASSLFYYNQVKGKVEDSIRALGFDQMKIFRPSLLLGERNESRSGEDFARFVSGKLPFIYSGPLRKFKPIHGREVAQGMYNAAQKEQQGTYIYESEDIKKI